MQLCPSFQLVNLQAVLLAFSLNFNKLHKQFKNLLNYFLQFQIGALLFQYMLYVSSINFDVFFLSLYPTGSRGEAKT